VDNTQLASIESGLGKTVAANTGKRPTKARQDSVARGSSTPCRDGLLGITPVPSAGGPPAGALDDGLFLPAHAGLAP
jgi:hypothetical protein